MKATFFMLYCLLLSALFQGSFSAFKLPIWKNKHSKSSIVFPLFGNVYPKGYYQVTLEVGQPPQPYSLDIDTGSDLTWLQCDAPCAKCTPAPHSLYKPNKNVVTCKDPVCTSLRLPTNQPCHDADEQCDYEVAYADRGSSLGVLVKDAFRLRFTNGSIVAPDLVFGCGYSQEVPSPTHPPFTDGILGLGNGKSSIVSQLSNLGLIRNVVGHCLSAQGGGFLFFGDDVLPSSGIVWTPIVQTSSEKHYSLGPAELLFDGQATGVKDLPIIFDSGSTFSYFSSQAYNTLVSSIKKNIDAKQLTGAVDEQSLPVCWNGSNSFKSVNDATSYFKPLTLSFMKAKNVKLNLPFEAYLILTVRKICKPLKALGIHTVSLHPGASIDHQIQGLKNCEPEFLISTPERLKELLSCGAIEMSNVSFLVIDGLLTETGYVNAVESIVKSISGKPQTLVFSDCSNSSSNFLIKKKRFGESICQIPLDDPINCQSLALDTCASKLS